MNRRPPSATTRELQFSPAYGCTIIVIAIAVLGGSLAYAIYRGVEMNREIDKFTEKEPVMYPVEPPEDDARHALRHRISTFADAALAGGPAELALSASDLNHLIASEPLLRDFRGNTVIREIRSAFLIADVSQPMNSLLPGRPRYLNATFSLRPELDNKTVALTIIDITSPKFEIPRGFVELYAAKKHFQLDRKNKTFGPVLKTIRNVTVRDGKVVVSTAPPSLEPADA